MSPRVGPTSRARRVQAKKVVIVDDSATMRRWLRHHLEKDPNLTVVGEAADGHSARNVIKQTAPDVITLDIEMPGMDGLEFLDRLMRLRPLPVVMISSATRRGSDAAVRALSLGAVDCLLKPETVADMQAARDMARRVFSAACSTVSARKDPVVTGPYTSAADRGKSGPIILLGASTGGVHALETVLAALDPAGPPVVIVQHMPGTFLVSFTSMLERTLPQSVGLLRDGEPLHPGDVRVAPEIGHQHSGVRRKKDVWYGTLRTSSEESQFCPSVDALFASAQAVAGDVIAGVLTGLGNDGAASMKALRDGGARTIGQDESTSVVYGMPRAAFDMGAVEEQIPLHRFGEALNDLAAQHRVRRRARRS